MERKPTTSVGYPSELAVDARRMALHIATILGDLDLLERDFASPEHIGRKRRAEFLGDRNAPGLRQDAVGAVQRFLTLTRRGGR